MTGSRIQRSGEGSVDVGEGGSEDMSLTSALEQASWLLTEKGRKHHGQQ